MSRQRLDGVKLLDHATAEGFSKAYPISDYKNIFLTLATGGNAEASIKVLGSFSKEEPNLDDADFDIDNPVSYISIRDLEDGTNIDGTTWITLEGTDVVNSYLVNTPWIRWIIVQVSSYTAGTIDVLLNGFYS